MSPCKTASKLEITIGSQLLGSASWTPLTAVVSAKGLFAGIELEVWFQVGALDAVKDHVIEPSI